MTEGGRSTSGKPTQFEQENDLGRGGGEADDEILAEAWREAERRRSTANVEDEPQTD
jgi:hypothetical protein